MLQVEGMRAAGQSDTQLAVLLCKQLDECALGTGKCYADFVFILTSVT